MPMPPDAPMPQEAEAPAEQPAQGGGDAKQLLMDVNSGLAKIVQLAAKGGAPKEIVAELDASLQSFRSAVSKLMGGGAPSGPQPADAGSAAPEAGGNKNAVPMG